MARAPRNETNIAYWFEHELRQYQAAALDLGAIAAHAGRIVPVSGRASHGFPCHQVNVELGKRLGREVIGVPGGHIGYVTHPAEFAHALVRALAEPGHEPE